MFPTHGLARSRCSIVEFAREVHEPTRVPTRVKVLPRAVWIVDLSTPCGSMPPPVPLDVVVVGESVDSGDELYVGRAMEGESSSPLLRTTTMATTAIRMS